MNLKSGVAAPNYDCVSKLPLCSLSNSLVHPTHQQRLKPLLLAGCFCLGLILSTATSAQARDFQAVEQPLAVKLGVTTLGIGLIVLELWWFLAKRKKDSGPSG